MPERGLRKWCSEDSIERPYSPRPVDSVRRGLVRPKAGRYGQTRTALEVSGYSASELKYQGGATGQGPSLSGGVPAWYYQGQGFL